MSKPGLPFAPKGGCPWGALRERLDSLYTKTGSQCAATQDPCGLEPWIWDQRPSRLPDFTDPLVVDAAFEADLEEYEALVDAWLEALEQAKAGGTGDRKVSLTHPAPTQRYPRRGKSALWVFRRGVAQPAAHDCASRR